MADYTSRRTMMVDTQVRPSDVTKFPIIEALLSVPREKFVPAAKIEVAYVGENIDIGNGRVMLEPRTFAKMLDALDIQPDDLVLDVGCGLGYSSAVIARMAEAVVAIEDSSAMADDAQSLLTEHDSDNVAVVSGQFVDAGKKHGPYDVIIIEGAVEEIPPVLIGQLKDGGKLAAIFMDGDLGVCRIGHKIDGNLTWRFAFNASAPVLEGFERARDFVL